MVDALTAILYSNLGQDTLKNVTLRLERKSAYTEMVSYRVVLFSITSTVLWPRRQLSNISARGHNISDDILS
jgi:hypothetical protein